MKTQFLYLLIVTLFSSVIAFAQTGSQASPQDEDLHLEAREFNHKPLRDFAVQYGTKILNKEIDMNAPLEIILTGTLDANGKITNAVVKSQKGDNPQTLEAFKAGIQVISDSEALRLLYDIGARDITTTTVQGQSDLRIKMEAPFPTESAARRASHGITLILTMLKLTRPGADEVKLAEKVKADLLGKTLILNFVITNDEKNQLLERNLKMTLQARGL